MACGSYQIHGFLSLVGSRLHICLLAFIVGGEPIDDPTSLVYVVADWDRAEHVTRVAGLQSEVGTICFLSYKVSYEECSSNFPDF